MTVVVFGEGHRRKAVAGSLDLWKTSFERKTKASQVLLWPSTRWVGALVGVLPWEERPQKICVFGPRVELDEMTCYVGFRLILSWSFFDWLVWFGSIQFFGCLVWLVDLPWLVGCGKSGRSSGRLEAMTRPGSFVFWISWSSCRFNGLAFSLLPAFRLQPLLLVSRFQTLLVEGCASWNLLSLPRMRFPWDAKTLTWCSE